MTSNRAKKEQLKIFKGFSLDMASDLSGLEKREIDNLREAGVVSPEKTKHGYSYTFVDLLMLRLIKQIRLNNVALKNIKQAHEYLSDLDPTKSLNRYKLYVRTDTKQIVYFGERPDNKDELINASTFGQLHLNELLQSGALVIIPVGTQLEHVRRTVIEFDRDLAKSLQQKKVIPLDKLLARYELG